jgi:hypothetical protein
MTMVVCVTGGCGPRRPAITPRAGNTDYETDSRRWPPEESSERTRRPPLLAEQTLALLQGGLLLTQVRRDPDELRAAADAALALIHAAATPKRATCAFPLTWLKLPGQGCLVAIAAAE